MATLAATLAALAAFGPGTHAAVNPAADPVLVGADRAMTAMVIGAELQLDGWLRMQTAHDAEVAAEQAATARRTNLEERRVAPSPPPSSTGEAGCSAGGGGNSPVPAYITWRESHDDYCAVNSSSGAYGRYQIMPSTWSSSCSDLPRTPDGQDACANRISAGGTNLQPWAG